jgi:ketosteroid isomerase-like protein
MSQEYLDLVRREYEAFAARDFDALREIWHPEIEYEALDPETYRGHEELRQGFLGWSDLYEDWWIKAGDPIDMGDQVVVEETFGGRGIKGSSSGTLLEQAVVRLIRFKDGRIWRVKEYPTLAEALAVVERAGEVGREAH